MAVDVPAFFSRFERVVEIIEADDSLKQAGRLRYQYYKVRGYELVTHTIT
jgi:DNA polymerase-3 subunit chi